MGVALFGMVQSFGTLTTVAYEGALTIPLLAASAGSGLGTAIAVLGVLKLGAAALLLAQSSGEARSRHSRSAEDVEADEALILSLFGDRKFKKQVNPASAKAEYDLAAELGLAPKSQDICRQRYASCPYTMDEMMKALRNSHL